MINITDLKDLPDDTLVTFDLETCLVAGEGLVQFVPNNDFSIYGEAGDMLIRINMSSGDLEYGDNYNPNAACKVFWDCISQFKQPDEWEENANITATEILKEIRHTLELPERMDIVEHVKWLVKEPTMVSGKGSKVRTLPSGHDNFDNAMKVID